MEKFSLIILRKAFYTDAQELHIDRVKCWRWAEMQLMRGWQSRNALLPCILDESLAYRSKLLLYRQSRIIY